MSDSPPNKIDETLDELLADVQSIRRVHNAGKPRPFNRKTNWPDALVFINRTIHCKCGEIYISPNPIILLRFGDERKIIKEWMPRFNILPREKYEISEHAPICISCYETSQIDLSPIEIKEVQ